MRDNFDFIKMHADYLNPELTKKKASPTWSRLPCSPAAASTRLKLWISFQALGRDKLARHDRPHDCLGQPCCQSHPRIAAISNSSVEPQLSTVVFRYVPSQRLRFGRRLDQPTFASSLFDRGVAVIGHTRVRKAGNA